MKQAQFEREHAALWDEISLLLDGAGQDQSQLPALYRRLAQSLALAAQRGYSPALTDFLNHLAARCHRALYGTTVERPATLVQWMRYDFPRRVRAEWRLLTLILLLFWGSLLVCAALVWQDPTNAYLFTHPEQLEKMRQMYQPGALGKGRGGANGDLAMFGHYIWNNVSIAFRTFASGLFGGVPTLLIVLYNGIHGGVTAGWLTLDPVTRPGFLSFVATHSSFELCGLVLSGLAGMRMGLALIRPGRMRRTVALQAATQAMFPVLTGAALLTALAAFFEAFWSAHTGISASVKYAVAACCWASVILYFVFAGRRHAA
jgi:uncharacterized membrane protein SpoIIM required for sporulation